MLRCRGLTTSTTTYIYHQEPLQVQTSLIMGDRTAEEWLIRWKGYGQAHDTWEPIENLAGLEDDIAKFRNEKSQLEPLKLGKRKRRSPHNEDIPVVVADTNSVGAGGIEPATVEPSPSTEEDDIPEDDGESEEILLRPVTVHK
ncbi:hypothetical protein CYMTET_22717 [Cymbomonas tetramitiformis]|uniref:Chromo domain-containing protein n=1 Tax=Cymbomonas tetramitiformis TaxID=36881 RepID=A0AAE0FZP4_9CHLO|nr:hypothetical protein CYMTET_22717 [Cymbomonas tetramitiformis]